MTSLLRRKKLIGEEKKMHQATAISFHFVHELFHKNVKIEHIKKVARIFHIIQKRNGTFTRKSAPWGRKKINK